MFQFFLFVLLWGSSMNNLLVILRPREEVKKSADKAVEKFALMHGATLKVFVARSMNEVGKMLELKLVAIVFIEDTLLLPESNALRGYYMDQRLKPYIITSAQNFEMLVRNIPRDRVGQTSVEFSENFIFNSMWSAATQIIKSIPGRFLNSRPKNRPRRLSLLSASMVMAFLVPLRSAAAWP